MFNNSVEECFTLVLGYLCCSNTKIVFTDEDGDWGVENNNCILWSYENRNLFGIDTTTTTTTTKTTITKKNFISNSRKNLLGHFIRLSMFVDNRINNIVKDYKSSDNIRINSISNIDILEEYGFNERINNCPYKNEWEYNIYCSINSKLTSPKNVNADNTVGQPSKTNADPISYSSGIG
ncbi:hypothetical protein BCR32DRAFT_276793 [Anaeromyces robustus]|uniref:CBM10 domain-containing protein n=1 Tax=Anaeromyces robustus TaxID=1754192 RepID=A0A1Y1XGK3_9FUNG|nr:hypothetical protein BCR32DRAFT_276793 [Anaeromyces robustus]|eukprot:ORX84822.1 hypothetical protein BCR32DRAFT_276793 [Anaeromyces robustus]